MVPALQAKLLRFLEEKVVQARRRLAGHPGRRARHRRDQPQPRRRGEGRPLPRGPLLPPQRAAGDAAAAARRTSTTCRRWSRSTSTPSTASSARTSRRRRRRRCELLQRYGWPGNIRELRNAVERAMLLAERRLARAGRLPARCRRRDRGGAPASSCRPTASISRRSSAAWWSRRSSAAAGTRPARRRCSA